MVKRVISKRLIRIDRVYGTRYIQSKRTGKLLGRKSVRGYGDKTAVRRERKTGRIFGRTSKIKVRSSNRAKGYTRRTLR